MARSTWLPLLTLIHLSSHLAAGSWIEERQLDSSPTSTAYTYTTDTIIKPTANARFQVGIPIPVVWFIPKTPFNEDSAESFNVTIALNGQIGKEVSSSVAIPGYGEMDTDFTPDETWPESNNYQVFILVEYGMTTLKSDKFGIWGGGQTPTPTSTSVTSRARKTPPASKTTAAKATTSGVDTSTTAGPTSSPTSTAAAAAGGVSPTVLGGAIGGAVVGTLAIVGLIWFMRRRMSQSRASHGQTNSHINGGPLPPSYPSTHNSPAGNQAWPYQQMGGNSTASVNNFSNDYKGYSGVNELPTHMHQEPVELNAVPQRNSRIMGEMMGDTDWHNPPPRQPNQPHKYVYSPASYGQ
ncbi:hypothetical protein ABW21_db0200147 [Orbilia brochopaga]|nr:hypothetical protein ABW21_db0200147 [Drechslerella brochopaga]